MVEVGRSDLMWGSACSIQFSITVVTQWDFPEPCTPRATKQKGACEFNKFPGRSGNPHRSEHNQLSFTSDRLWLGSGWFLKWNWMLNFWFLLGSLNNYQERRFGV